jgi:hypothetical protein
MNGGRRSRSADRCATSWTRSSGWAETLPRDVTWSDDERVDPEGTRPLRELTLMPEGSRMESRRSLVALVLLVALAGCAVGEPGSAHKAPPRPTDSLVSEPPPTETPLSGPARTSGAHGHARPVRAREAARALDDGIVALLKHEAVDFRFTMRAGYTLAMQTSGRAFLFGGWRSSTTYPEEFADLTLPGGADQDYRMEVLAPGRDVFMQMIGWPEQYAGCWLQMRRGEVPIGILALTPRFPAYVGLLSAVQALGFEPGGEDDSQVVVTMPLRVAQLLMSGRAVRALRIPPAGLRGTQVRAKVFLEDGAVASMLVLGDDLADAVSAAGGRDVPAVCEMSLAVAYTVAPDHADPVTAPDPDLVISSADMAADRGCHGLMS